MPVSAQNETVRGEPEFEVFLPQNTVSPGEKVDLEIQIRNVGDVDQEGLDRFESQVTTSESVTVDPSSSDDIDVRTGESAVQDIPEGSSVTVPVTVVIPRDVDGANDINLDISYEHTRKIDYNETTEEVIDSFDREVTDSESVEVEVVSEARFEGDTIEDRIAIGERGVAKLSVENVGDEDVTDATLQLQSSTRNVLFGGSQSTSINIGELDATDSKSFETTVSFDNSASLTDYSISGVMDYTNENGQSKTASVDGLSLQPVSRINIPVESVETDTSIGSSGITDIEIENDGLKDLSDVTIQLSSESGAILFEGRSPQTTVSVGEWDIGETESFSVRTIATDDATQTSYGVSGTVMYEDEDGISNTVDLSSFMIEPLSEQDVEAEIDSSNLREGERGSITLKVVNNGPKEAEDVRIDVRNSGSADLLSEEFNIGSIEVDDSVLINVPAEVPENIDDLNQALDVDTTYNYGDNNEDTEKSALSVEINQNRDRFDVSLTDGKIEAGQSKTIKLEVTNSLSEGVSNMDAEFGTSGPISVSEDSAFISSLSPNETTSLDVQIQADSGAVLNSYPLEVDFQYEESDGTDRLSKVYSVPIDVQEPTDDSGNRNIILIGIGVLVLIVLGLIIYYREDIREKIQ